MATLKQMRQALKTTIQNVFDGRGIEIHGYDVVSDNVEGPAFVVRPAERGILARLDKSNKCGAGEWDLWIVVMVPLNEYEHSQDVLDDFLAGHGDRSIIEILWNHDDIGLDDTTVQVTGVRGYDARRLINNIQYVGAVITVTAYTSGA